MPTNYANYFSTSITGFPVRPTTTMKVKLDTNNDGIVDRIETREITYTTSRFIQDVYSHIDDNADGTIDRTQSSYYFNSDISYNFNYGHNDLGLRTSTVLSFRSGTVFRYHNYEYNDQGQPTFYDDGVHHRHSFVYDEQGQLARQIVNDRRDGSVVHVHNYEYNDQGLLSRATKHQGVNRPAHETSDLEYNEQGLLTRKTYTSLGSPGSNSVTNYEYNDQGVRTRETTRDANDNVASVRTWEVDDRGHVIRYEVDEDANGIANFTANYTYSASGLLSGIESHYNGYKHLHKGFTSTLPQSYTGNSIENEFDYNSDGNIDRIYRDSDSDGTPHEIVDYTYNTDGVRISEKIQFDTDDDGTINRIETRIDENQDGIWDEIRYHDSGDEDTIDRREVYQILVPGPNSEPGSFRAVINDTDNDGTYDSVQVGANANFTISARYGNKGTPYRKIGTGLNDIQLHESAPSELTLIARRMRFTFGKHTQSQRNPDHELLIKGDADDTVKLVDTDRRSRGDFVIRDANNDGNVDTKVVDGKTYAIYDARWKNSPTGSVLIESGVKVILPGHVSPLETINNYDGTNTAPTVIDYTNAGVKGVSSNNLDGLNAQVADSDDPALTIPKIQALVAKVNALIKINEYDGTASTAVPTEDDYAVAGVTRVTSTNLADVNIRVATSQPDLDLATSDIQRVVERVNASRTDYANYFSTTITGFPVRPATTMKVKLDTNNDGTVDRIETREITYTTSRFIQDVYAHIDDNADGTIDRTQSSYYYNSDISYNFNYEHNDQGLRTRTVLSFRSGSVFRYHNYEYNDQGQPTFYDDGVYHRHSFVYNEQGQVTRQIVNDRRDGSVVHVHNYEYNDQGLLSRVTKNLDVGHPAYETSDFVYNEQGLLTRKTFTSPGSPRSNTVTDYEYNDQGVRTRETIRDADGSVDSVRTWEVDDRGHIIRYEVDEDANGIANFTANYTYNGLGLLTGINSHFNGYRDWYRVGYTRTLPQSTTGNPIENELDYNNDDNIDRIYKDSDSDGTLDEIVDYTYASGAIDRIETRIDKNQDGIWDEIRYHDNGDEDTIDRREVYQTLVPDPDSGPGSFLAVINDTDNDGTYDSVQVGANANFTLSAKYGRKDTQDRKIGTGLNDIQLHESAPSELTLIARRMRFTFAKRTQSELNPDHELLIQGDADDTVKLVDTDSRSRGDFVIRDANNDGNVDTKVVDGKTYAIYDARWNNSPAGSVLIESGVKVILPGHVSPLETINNYDGTNTAPTVTDYTNAGVKGVSSNNLDGLNAQVADSDDPALTIPKIQALVAKVNALIKINEYDGTASTAVPTVDDYAAAGVTRVTSAYLADVNIRVATSQPDLDLTTSDIQRLLDRVDASKTDYANYFSTSITGFPIRPTTTMKVKLDTNDDGTVDRIETREITYTTSRFIQDVYTHIDDNADGTIDRTQSSYYFNSDYSYNFNYEQNDEGLRTRTVLSFRSGRVFRYHNYEYNDQGQPTFYDDGVYHRHSFVYNEQGQLTRQIVNNRRDGSVVHVHNYEYNDQGLLSRATKNMDVNHPAYETSDFEYNEQGLLTRKTFTSPGSPSSNSVTNYEYNDQGVRTRELVQDADGRWDTIRTWEVDNRGHVIRYVVDEYANGIANFAANYTYNDLGLLTGISSHFNDYRDSHQSGFTSNLPQSNTGNPIENEFDFNSDGNIDRIYMDFDSNGTLDEIVDYTYANGAIDRIETRIDKNQDGIWDEIRYQNGAGEEYLNLREVFQVLVPDPDSEPGSFLAVLNDLDNDGTYESVQVGANAEFTLSSRYGDGEPSYQKVEAGLDDIRLHDSTPSELTLPASRMDSIHNGDPAHELIIQGGSDDRVNLVGGERPVAGNFVIRDADNDGIVDTKQVGGKTYAIYDASLSGQAAGSVLIEEDVSVHILTQ